MLAKLTGRCKNSAGWVLSGDMVRTEESFFHG